MALDSTIQGESPSFGALQVTLCMGIIYQFPERPPAARGLEYEEPMDPAVATCGSHQSLCHCPLCPSSSSGITGLRFVSEQTCLLSTGGHRELQPPMGVLCNSLLWPGSLTGVGEA